MVLTDTVGLRIVGWISDAEVLIQRDIVPRGKGSAIEVLNVKTRAVRRLAEGRLPESLVWNPVEQALVYLQYDEVRKRRDLMWYPLDAGEAQKLASDVFLPIVLVDGEVGQDVRPYRGRLDCRPLNRCPGAREGVDFLHQVGGTDLL
jgi:hypothetical protein